MESIHVHFDYSYLSKIERAKNIKSYRRQFEELQRNFVKILQPNFLKNRGRNTVDGYPDAKEIPIFISLFSVVRSNSL